jgi:acyl dehydratase
MLAGGAWSIVPPTLRQWVDDVDEPVHRRVSTGSDELLDAHAAWAGAPPDRYRDLVPPHSLARWAMPVIARLTSKAPLELLRVLNQGVDVQVLQPIPRGVDLDLVGRLVDVVEEETRVRVDTTLTATLPDGDAVLHLGVHAVVPTGPRSGRDRPHDERVWQQLGSFAATHDDGKRFFWLTGDFNPIHTVEAIARRTRFGGCILHGFGTLARTWETVVDAGLEMADVRVRFTAPNPLPNPQILVERAEAPDADGRARVRARGRDGTTYLVATLA